MLLMRAAVEMSLQSPHPSHSHYSCSPRGDGHPSITGTAVHVHNPHMKLILCLLHSAASICGLIFILKQHENSVINDQLLFFSPEDKTTTGLKF